MSEKKTYNPFNPVGRYNIETYLYENKKIVLGIVIIFILILIVLGMVVWGEGKTPHKNSIDQTAVLSDLPPPKYGKGPFGYGIYAPPKSFFQDPPDLVD